MKSIMCILIGVALANGLVGVAAVVGIFVALGLFDEDKRCDECNKKM